MKSWLSSKSRRPARSKRSHAHLRSMLLETLEKRELMAVSVIAPAANWNGIGPVNLQGEVGTSTDNVVGITNNVGVGAVQSIAVADAKTVYIGTVNGGVWKTNDITIADPHWTPLTDTQKSLAIGSLRIDPNDISGRTVWAGIGSFSNSGTITSNAGLLKTTDGGATWQQLGGLSPNLQIAFQQVDLTKVRITSVVPTTVSDTGNGPGLGGKIVFASGMGFNPAAVNQGLYISRDGGSSFASISDTQVVAGDQGALTKFPQGGVSDLVPDASDSRTLYAALPGKGIYRTVDAGTTWTSITAGIPANQLTDSSMIRLSSANAKGTNVLYVGIVGKDNQLSGLYRSTNKGTNWTALNLPGTVDSKGVFTGIHPGHQGNTNFAIVADPSEPNFVWVSGDRQPDLSLNGSYSARIFIIDATKDTPNGLNTHGTQVVGATSPHPDSRALAFLNNSTLLEADDGGIYQLATTDKGRTWTSRNGDLQDSEVLSTAYDPVNDVVLAGTQDNGSLYQVGGGSKAWALAVGGDGNSQAVGVEANSVYRYSLGNSFNKFIRQEFSTANKPVGSEKKVALAAKGSKTQLSGLDADDKNLKGFATIPVVVNAVDPKRLAIAYHGMYVSADRGDTISNVSSSASPVSAVAYGGRSKSGTADPDRLYFARDNQVFVQKVAGGPLTQKALPGASKIFDLVVDPNNDDVAYAVDSMHVFATKDAGVNWVDITGSLAQIADPKLRTIEIVALPNNTSTDPKAKDVLLVGGAMGVYRAVNPIGDPSGPNHYTPSPDTNLQWSKFGSSLPNARVSEIVYSGPRTVNGKSVGDVLVVSTIGRGVWQVRNASIALRNDSVLKINGDSANDLIELTPDAKDPSKIDVVVNDVLLGTYPSGSFTQIRVDGAGGNDQLSIDTRINPPPGGIVFDGGAGINKVQVVGNIGDAIVKETNSGNTANMVLTSAGGTHDFTFSNIQVPVAKLNLDARPGQAAGQLQAGLGQAGGLFDRLRAKLPNSLPAISNVNGILGGKAAAAAAASDPDAAPQSQALADLGTSLFTRLFEEGKGGFPLSKIGTSIVDLQAVRALFDGLDDINGNVTLVQSNAKSVLDIKVEKLLRGNSDFNLSLLGEGFKLGGSVDMSALVHVHLIVGVDDRGFYIDTNNPDPEISVTDVHVAGDIALNSLFGLVKAGLTNTSFDTGTGVGVSLKLHEAADPLGASNDGLIRPYEFNLATLDAADANLTSNPNHDAAHPDVAFKTDIYLDFGGNRTNVPGVGVAWVDINNPSQLRLTGLDPLVNIMADVKAAVVNGLTQVGDFAKDIDSSDPMNQPLDFLGKNSDGTSRTLGNTLNVDGLFNDRLVTPVKDYFAGLTVDPSTGFVDLPTLEGLQEAILHANGLENGLDSTFGPGFEVTQEDTAIVIDFPVHFDRELPISLGLGIDVEGLTIDSAANVKLRTAFDADLAVGFDIGKILSKKPTDALFVEVNTAPTISAQIIDEGGVSFSMMAGGILGLGADLRGTLTTPQGPAMFTASVGLTFKDPNGDGVLTFSDLRSGISNLFSITPSANVGLKMPVTVNLGGVDLGIGNDKPEFQLKTVTAAGLFDRNPNPIAPAGFKALAGGRLLLQQPDFKRLVSLGLLFGAINSADKFLDGLDKALRALQDGLDSEVTQSTFPLVGNRLSEGAQFIEDFRTQMLAQITANSQNAGNRLIELIQTGLFELLGPANLNMLVNSAGQAPTVGAMPSDFIKVTFPADSRSIQLEMDLHKDKTFALPFDLGLPGLDFALDAAGAVQVALGFDLHLGFGVSLDSGVYLTSDFKDAQNKPKPEASLSINVTTPNLDVAGQLGILGIRATDGDNETRILKIDSPSSNGTFSLTFRGQTTTPLPLNASALQIQNALENLSTIGMGNIEVHDPLVPSLSSNEFTLVFTKGLRNRDITVNEFAVAAQPAPGRVTLSTQANGGVTSFKGKVSIDFVDPTSPTDGRIKITELSHPADVFKPLFDAVADIHLHLLTSVGDVQLPDVLANLNLQSSLFPKLETDFNVNWLFNSSSTQGVAPKVSFDNVQLNLGSFISDFAYPLIENLKKFTKPLEPIIDALKKPIPGLNDLALMSGVSILGIKGDAKKNPFTFLALFGKLAVSQGYADPTDFVAVIDALNKFDTTGGSSIMLDLGHFEINDSRTKGVSPTVVAPVSPGSNLISKADSATASSASPNGFFTRIKTALKVVSFPILEDPTNIFKLIINQSLPDNGTLFKFTPPALTNGGFRLDQDFPLPFAGDLLSVGMGGAFSLTTNLTFGYDLQGMKNFVAHGKQDPTDLLDGFYMSTINPNRPALTFNGTLTGNASAGPNLAELGKVVVGFEGGARAAVTVTPRDPNFDGKTRLAELVDSLKNGFSLFPNDPVSALSYAFDMTAQIDAVFNLFAKISALNVDVAKISVQLGSIKLYQFSTSRQLVPGVVYDPPTADFGALDSKGNIVQGLAVDEGGEGLRLGFKNPKGGANYTFFYDLDGNGSFETSNVGAVVQVDKSNLNDGPGYITLRGRIVADTGLYTDYSTLVNVRNVAPKSQFKNDGPKGSGPVTVAFSNDIDAKVPLAPKVTGGNDGNSNDPLFHAYQAQEVFVNSNFSYATNNVLLKPDPASTTPIPVAAPPGSTWVTILPALAPGGQRLGQTPPAPQADTTDIKTTVDTPSPATTKYQVDAKIYFLAANNADLGNQSFSPQIFINGETSGNLVIPFSALGTVTLPALPRTSLKVTIFEGKIDIPSSLLKAGSNEIRFHLYHPGYVGFDKAIQFAASITGTTFSTSAFDPSPTDTAAGFTYSYDFNNDGTFDTGPNAVDIVNSRVPYATVPSSLLTSSPLTVHGRISDKDGGSSDYYTTILPSAGLIGPYTISEGDNLEVDANRLPPSVFYEVRVNGKPLAIGGVTQTIPWALLKSAAVHSSSTPYTLEVNGFQTTLTVLDTAPKLSIEGDSTATEGELYSLKINAPNDPADDSIHQWNIDWGDGIHEFIVIENGTAYYYYPEVGLDGRPLTRPVNANEKEPSNLFRSLGPINYPLSIQHRFMFPASGYSINVQGIDVDGTYFAPSLPVAIKRTAPELSTMLLSSRSISEGDEVTLSGVFKAFINHTVHDVTVDWGDNSPKTKLNLNKGERAFGDDATRELRHRYDDNSPASGFPVKVTVTDDAGLQSTLMLNVQVANVAPQGTFSHNTAIENSPVLFTSNFLDAGRQDMEAGLAYSWSVTSENDSRESATSNLKEFQFTPQDSGNYLVRLKVTDKDGGTTTMELPLTVANVAPKTSIVRNGTDNTEGSVIELSATASDVSAIDSAAALHYSWQLMKDGRIVAMSSTNQLRFIADDDGVYKATFQAFDKDGGTGESSISIDIANVAPTAEIQGVPDSISEGTPLHLSAVFADAGLVDSIQGLKIAWRFMDGPNVLASSTQPEFNLTAFDSGTYSVELQITDKDAATTIVRKDILVTNVAPTPSVNGADANFFEGSPVNLKTTAFDPSPRDNAAAISFAWTVLKNGITFVSGAGTDISFVPDDNGVYEVTVSCTDVDGDTGSATLPIVVENVAPSVIFMGNPGTVKSSSPVLLLATGVDASAADVNAGLALNWTVTKDGNKFAEGVGPEVRFTTTTKGEYQVNVLVKDKDGGLSLASTSLNVTNAAPTGLVPTLSSASIVEGSNARLSIVFADPDTLDTHVVRIDWGDGSAPELYNLRAGVQTLPAKSHRYLDNPTNPNTTYPINVQVTDAGGEKATGTVNVTVKNAVPVAKIDGPTTAARGQLRNFTMRADDVSPVDLQAGYGYQIKWGDGKVESTRGGTEISLQHKYAAAGNYNVTVTATDKDGGTSRVASLSISVKAIDLQGDVLVIGGTTGNDNIEVDQEHNGVKVKFNRCDNGSTYKNVHRVVIYGQAGDDRISGGNLEIDTEIFGDEGNDILTAGKGNSILVGGAGNDQLNARSGRNLLIGGQGRDQLNSGGGENILVSGATNFDANELALLSLMNEWKKTGVDRATRIKHITGTAPGGANGSVVLNSGTIVSDHVVDRLTGKLARDLVFRDLEDLYSECK